MDYIIFKIKEGKEGQWKMHCDYLRSQKELVLTTLREENLLRETNIKIGNYILYEIKEGNGGIKESTAREINLLHKAQRKDCLEKTSLSLADIPDAKKEVLFDFSLE